MVRTDEQESRYEEILVVPCSEQCPEVGSSGCNELFMQSQSDRSARGLAAASQFARCAHPTRRLRRGRIARDHESWPGGESRKARFEASPCRSGFRLRLARRQVAASALRAFAARQDTNAACAAHEYAPSWLHEYRATFCHNRRGMPFDAKKELRICYKGVPIEKTYIPDFFCHGKHRRNQSRI